MLMHLRRLLETKHNVVVKACILSLAALLEAGNYAFDLVLINQHMQGMNGIAFIRDIRASARCAQAPIAMNTTNVFDAVQFSALAAGATDFLDMRIGGVELNVRLRNLVRVAGAARHLD